MALATRLDGLPLSRFHWYVMIISGIGWAINGLNTTIISFVFPLVVTEWGLTPQEVGMIGSGQFVGMMIGAATAGGLSDRYGRKTVFQATLALLCIATLLTSLAWDYWSLMAIRVIAALGTGGILPVAMTLVSEFSPSRRRGLLIVNLDAFWTWGTTLAALVAFLVMTASGWRSTLFWLGIIPLLHVVVLNRALLESPRYLLGRGRRREAEEVVREVEARCGVVSSRLAGNGVGTEGDVAAKPRVTLGELWSRQLRKTTICCWLMNFSMVFGYYGIFLWLPTLLVAAGHDMGRSFEFVLIMNVAQLPGYYVAAYLVDRVGRRPILMVSYLLYAACAYLLGVSAGPAEILLWGCLAGFFNSAVFSVVWAYTPESYPTRLRATASGWASGFGRLGGLVAPSAVGILLGSWSGSYTPIFVMVSGMLLVGAASITFLGQETKGRSLEDITV